MNTRPKISNIIEDHIPDHILASSEKFVIFIKKYYEIMEEHDIDFQKIKDIDETNTDLFLDRIHNEVGIYIPKTNSSAFLLKNLKDLYLAKGTEDSFKILTRLLLNKELQDIFYPWTKTIKVSTGADRNEETGGTISGNYYIQDSDYYQLFSYVLKAKEPIISRDENFDVTLGNFTWSGGFAGNGKAYFINNTSNILVAYELNSDGLLTPNTNFNVALPSGNWRGGSIYNNKAYIAEGISATCFIRNVTTDGRIGGIVSQFVLDPITIGAVVATEKKLFIVSSNLQRALSYNIQTDGSVTHNDRDVNSDINLGTGVWAGATIFNNKVFFTDSNKIMLRPYDINEDGTLERNEEENPDIRLDRGDYQGALSIDRKLYLINNSTKTANSWFLPEYIPITPNETKIIRNILHPAGMKLFFETNNTYNR